MAACSRPRCSSPAAALGLCSLHYNRQYHGWKMDAPKRKRRMLKGAPPVGSPCTIPGCDGTVIARGKCWNHYQRERRGTAIAVVVEKRPGNKHRTAVKYGCRKPTRREHRLAMAEWWLREGMVTPEPMSGCLLWFGSLHPNGYGMVGASGDPWGRWAHRAALYFAGVDLPRGSGWHVRHLCDNPVCVNPRHLSCDRAWMNARDRDRRLGRRSLTPDVVAGIKAELLAGVRPAVIARRHALVLTTIINIRSGKSWRWVEPAVAA